MMERKVRDCLFMLEEASRAIDGITVATRAVDMLKGGYESALPIDTRHHLSKAFYYLLEEKENIRQEIIKRIESQLATPAPPRDALAGSARDEEG